MENHADIFYSQPKVHGITILTIRQRTPQLLLSLSKMTRTGRPFPSMFCLQIRTYEAEETSALGMKP